MMYEPHDVVEFKANGETVTGVIITADDESAKIRVPKNTFETTVETETVWVEGNTAYVSPSGLTHIGSPDTESIHPEDYRVEAHVNRLENNDDETMTETENEPEKESTTIKCTHGMMTKGIPECSKDATHTGGSYYPGPVCEKHTTDDSEPLTN